MVCELEATECKPKVNPEVTVPSIIPTVEDVQRLKLRLMLFQAIKDNVLDDSSKKVLLNEYIKRRDIFASKTELLYARKMMIETMTKARSEGREFDLVDFELNYPREDILHLTQSAERVFNLDLQVGSNFQRGFIIEQKWNYVTGVKDVVERKLKMSLDELINLETDQLLDFINKLANLQK